MNTLNVPVPADPMPASKIIESIAELDRLTREKALYDIVVQGHVPEFQRTLHDVSILYGDVPDALHTLTIYVLNDYLRIGTNDDSVLLPLTPLTAQRIADVVECMLPTPAIVDAVWRAANAAKRCIAPRPWGPPYDSSMLSTARFVAHSSIVDKMFEEKGIQHGTLVAGHKKDVVLTNRLVTKQKQVAIYGWHKANGQPIQPLSLIHENTYCDYSHGIRLVSNVCKVDGVVDDLRDVLQSKETCKVVSNEGALMILRQPDP